jgi:hypothetical protein
MVMKKFILGIFSILPKKLYTLYLSLCLYIFVKKVKENDVDENSIDATQLSNILNITLNRESFIFPLATYDWIWNNETLLIKVLVCENNDCQEKTLFDIIKKKETLVKSIDYVASCFLQTLPKCTKRALNLETDVISLINMEKLFKSVILAAAR